MTYEAGMKNPAMILPGALPAIQGLIKAAHQAGLDPQTLELVHLRTSQINGCSACIDAGGRNAEKIGLTGERF